MSVGKFRRIWMKASMPPAEAPTPTIRKGRAGRRAVSNGLAHVGGLVGESSQKVGAFLQRFDGDPESALDGHRFFGHVTFRRKNMADQTAELRVLSICDFPDWPLALRANQPGWGAVLLLH